ncbi:interferon-inducible GTPase-domain-containing protein [Pisolithus orientalis]|uniref:interferon-inducible GTPase-domain-containing protein n=1 Tax=Pisolithus orientalis TaxID=936130 RepID=UPI002224D32B|nr:interferon-inducible GTPase-domain-containing protein [Pisolithus orientalis]KAI6034835.1 interferon-inducible GTPase-domain-containing protein [Pisolithus orientalis]
MCFTEDIKPDVPNQALAEIEAREKAEEQRVEAERREKEAREVVERIQREAEEERQRARALQEEADRAAAKAREDMERVRMEMAEANERAMRAQAEAEAAATTARGETEKLVQQAAAERERARQAEEEARRLEVAAREEAERAEAEKAMAAAAAEARKATAAKEEAELRWKKGIRPVVTPSLEELKKAKERIQYQEGFFHFAVTGVAGSGKSSLVNAFRGLRNRDSGAAATGVTETTLEIARYSDPNHNHQLLWFDIPGAGTLKVPDWQYFNEHGLYVFDCIIVLSDTRFTMTDIAILSNARRFDIPAYIVRSKADQNIRNIMRDMGYDSDEDEEDNPGRRNKLYKAARKQYIEKTRESVKINLENANLPDQRVYLVSNDTVLSCTTTQRLPKKVIDEVELLTDIYTQVVSRRSLPREDDGLLSSLRSAKGKLTDALSSAVIHGMRSRSPPAAPNPSVAEIEARNLAEKATRDAQAAKELAEKIQNDALAESQRMQARLDAVTGEAAEAEEDARRMRDAIIASESRARAAQAAAEAAAATQQEALKQAKEELERARQTIEEARRAEAAARAEAERRWQAAEEGRRRAEAARADADRATRAAQAEVQKAAAAKEEAEKRWKAGIQPVAKRRIQYKEGVFHFAVAGVAGSGKSSLINAFRGLRNKDAGAAATGVIETTLTTTRYPDPNPQHPFVWFDIPGAGTLKITDWQYFNAQGLYVFDCIIVLFDNRFTMTDIAILSNARRFQIPTYIIWEYDSEEDDEDDPGRRKRLYTAARRQYIEETRKSVKTNLENAGLPDQRVYIVSNDNLLGMPILPSLQISVSWLVKISPLKTCERETLERLQSILAFSRDGSFVNEMNSSGLKECLSFLKRRHDLYETCNKSISHGIGYDFHLRPQTYLKSGLVASSSLIQVTMSIHDGFGEGLSQPNAVLSVHPFALGPVLIGGLVSAMLYGITTLQGRFIQSTYMYYMNYSEDPSMIQLVVAAICLQGSSCEVRILDTLQVSFSGFLITNYGNLMSLEHDVWSFPASALVNLFVIIAVQWCHQSCEVVGDCPNYTIVAGSIWVRHRFTNNGLSSASQVAVDLFSDMLAVQLTTTYVLAEVLITVSLCLLLYDNGSHSAFPRTKRLLNTLIIYAVNRCLLSLLVAIAELVAFIQTVENQNSWAMGMEFVMGKSSLNTRQHLRSQDSSTDSELCSDAVRFANLSKLSDGVESSKVRERHIEHCEEKERRDTGDFILHPPLSLFAKRWSHVMSWKGRRIRLPLHFAVFLPPSATERATIIAPLKR